MASISDDCLSSSDFVHVSADFSSRLVDDVSVEQDFTRPADQENLRQPSLKEAEDDVKRSFISLNTDMKDSIGFDSANDCNGTNNESDCSVTSSPESFSIIDQSQITHNTSSKSPMVNPLVFRAIGDIGVRLASHSGMSSSSTLKTSSTEPMEGSRESDLFRMSTTESNDSIIVLDDGDLKSSGEPSVTSEMSDSSQTHVMQVESNTNEDFSLVSAQSMTSPDSQVNKEADFEQSLRLESFDGFESLLNTKDKIGQEDSENDMDLHSPGSDGQSLSSQTDAANKTSVSHPSTNHVSLINTDDLKSFEVPRNSLEWWPENGTGNKKSKSGPSTQSFESYQMLSGNLGTSLEIDCDSSVTTGVNSLSNSMQKSLSAEPVQNNHSSDAYQSSPVQCTSLQMQSFSVSKPNQSVSIPHRDGDGNSSLPEEETKATSVGLQSEQLAETPSTIQQNVDRDSDLFGTKDEISGEPAPDKWSFQQEETKYKSTQFVIMQALKDYVTTHGHIGHSDIENVSTLIADVLTDQNSQRKELNESHEMDDIEPCVEADPSPDNQMVVTEPAAEGVPEDQMVVAETAAEGGPEDQMVVAETADKGRPEDQMVVTETADKGRPEDFSLLSVSQPTMEDKMDDDYLDLVGNAQEEVAGEYVASSSGHSQVIPVSSVQLRLLCMMDGKSVLKKKYDVTMEKNVQDKAVILKGTIENINLAIKSIQDNEWLAEYCMKVTKLHPLLINLLNLPTVETFLDLEKFSKLEFSFCWLSVVESSCLILYADTEQNAQAVLNTISQTALLKTTPKPQNMLLLKEKMNSLMQKNDGKILYCEEDDSVVIAYCNDVTDEVNQCLQSLEVKMKRKETEKFVQIEGDIFAYIKKWKMPDLERMASSHYVGLSDGLGTTSGFIVMGTQDNVQAAVGLILDLVSQISSRRISIKSPEAAELFKMNDFALVGSLERFHHCCIKVEHIEMYPSSGERAMDISQGKLEDVEFPVFKVDGQVEIHIFCGQVSQTDTEMLVEPAERLENTPYGKCRFLYIEKQKKKAAKVVVPTWNTESGKEKHELTDMLVEMFDDLKKHGFKSVAFPVRNFRNWPHGKLTKAIIVGLQTHIKKCRNPCDLQMVTLFDPERDVCNQICQVCRNAVGDTITEMSIQPQRRPKQGLTIELVRGEIAKQTTDVIVNTTTKTLQLNSGKVSKSIFERAGSEIQTQLNNYHPLGITVGDIAVTRGFKLDCKFVYHGALEPWPQLHAADSEKSHCLEMLENFVKQCLSQADQRGVNSISFPALGCGTLNMPPVQVVQSMIKVFRQFEKENPSSSVEEIHIVIYPADGKIFKEFEKELKKYEQEKVKIPSRKQTHVTRQISLPAPRVSVSSQPSRRKFSCCVNGIQLTAASGDVTKQDKYDGLVRLFTNDPFLADMGDDPVLKSISPSTTLKLKETTVMSFSKNFVTPAGDLPQKKIVHVHASPHHLQQDILTALSTAENDGSFKSLVIPVRSNDPLCEDGRTFMSSVYQAVSKFTKLGNYKGRVREVKLCVTDPQILNTVLEELQLQSSQGETDVKIAGLDEHRLLVLRVTSMNSKMDELMSKIRSIESTPNKYVEKAMEGELEIPNVAQDVYEAFLFFYYKELQTQLTSLNMRYEGRGSKIILVGPFENLRGSEAFVKQMLQELTDRVHVDTIPLPNLENSVLQSMVSEIQPLFKEALLFVPVADHFNGIHVIALSSEDAQRVKRSTMEKISHNPDTSPLKITLSASRQHPVLVDFRSDVHTFITEQNIQVFVYKENILELPVSCIVNAANEYLQHGSGVALAILQAAGISFDHACKEHIKRNGLVKVGTCAETEAGDLPYAYVINTVGPRWNSEKESLCKTQLHSAVESSIVKAAELGMNSVGIPAISSGIFGMPVDICAYQYAYAVISASSKIEGSSLKEIHFIDVDDEAVVVMKQIFSSIFSGNTDSVPRLSLSINSASLKPVVDLTPTGSLNIDGRVSPDFPKSYTYQNGGVVFHEYHLTNDFSIQVYTGNIVKSATNVIVCPEDKDLKHEGDVSKAVFALGGKELQFSVEEYKEHNTRPGDVFVVDAGRNFDETVSIFMVISPVYEETDSEEEWLESVNTCHTKVLQMASHWQVYNIAMPLMGTIENSTHVSIVSSCMVKQITDFVNNRPPGCQLNSIHIVNIQDETTLAITRSLDDYVTEERTKLQSMMRRIGNCNISENVQEIPMDVEECDTTQPEYQNIPYGSESNHVPSKQAPATAADDQHCVICLEMVDEDYKTLPKCQHQFCKPCIERQFKFKPVCPTCGEVYGIVYGTQPQGTMTVQTIDQSIPGFPKCRTHVITYDFKEGIQGEEHPNPGVSYRGERRMAYLPDCPKGQLALKLLKIAFDRRLVFTIGFSRTTGRDNVITWNDIHHKTNMRGGPERFGYPDPEYLDRLLEELTTKGVSEKDLNP